MKYVSIEKGAKGRFITRYDVTYETELGNRKVYEIISRNSDISGLDDLHSNSADAVVIIAHDSEHEKILINKEFRMAVGEWVYNFPAGLIDAGETAEVAARRELWEETGLTLDTIEDVIGESYSAVGFSNEKNVCVVCTASGEFNVSTSDVEEIEADWYTKEQVRDLLKKYRFAARTQAYCYVWSKA